MVAQYLWVTGSAIIGLAGLSHVRATLWTNMLYPRNEKLIADMKISPLQMTEKLTMWKSWMGFNATHGSGAAFVGIINFYLALYNFTFLKSSQFLLLLTLLTMAFYVWIARKYWFKPVFLLITAAWTCFMASYILLMM
ncbi:hypothetical protein HGH92_33130 [Chitinophaga varians]|uniref:Uncharacterized protein n=1 Tax=Chitinophaga varians TaxID=2202339 RepID=A0A847S806_9BACT|nr:hypothetical protein [Chitinophaga varians]NLR69188.1 hypothetical protein [Chitinophaga varians]